VRHRASLGLAIVLAAISIGAQPAVAGFHVCNESSLRVDVAVGYVDQASGGWVSEGWWLITANQCREIITSDLNNRYYYFYATGTDGDKIRTKWSGETSFCIQREKFTLHQAEYGQDTEADCAKAGLRSAKFKVVDVHGSKNHTVKLHASNSPSNNQPVAGNVSGSSSPQLQAPAQQGQQQFHPPAVAGGGTMQQRPYQPPVAPVQQAAPTQTTPGAGGASAACQRYPNLC
jgi:uncharacterized membrane protein